MSSESLEVRRDELPLADRTMELRSFVRAAAAADESVPLATAELVFTTGAGVKRYDWRNDRYYLEELVVEAGAIRLGRLQAGAPLLNTHDDYRLESVLGVVDSPVVERGEGICSVKFSRRPSVAGYVQDVADGIIRNVSVGYVRHRVEMVAPEAPDGVWSYRVTDWEPYEVSLVPIPADAGAQVRSAGAVEAERRDRRTFPCEFMVRTAEPSQPAATREVATAGSRSPLGVTAMTTATQEQRESIESLCRHHRVPDLAADMISRGITVEAARGEIIDALVRSDQAAGGHLNVRGSLPGAAERECIVNTLVQRLGGRAQGEVIRSLDMVGIARRALELSGQRVFDDDSRDRILQRALTTSDYPNLLGNAVGRVLQAAYDETPAALKPLARQANLPDFRDKTSIRLGPNSGLLKVNEHGEYKYGSIEGETENTWKLDTYGRIISVTRKALINDDLGGFNSLITKFGQAAARFEADQFVSVLTSTPQVDGAALFATSRNTQIAGGAGSVLGSNSLADAVKMMRAQKDLDGGLVLQEPAFLVVPAALEMMARQLVAEIQPAQTSNVQPFKLTVIVEPRLDAISATAWYLVARGQDSLEYGYLEGSEGVQTFVQEGFEIDGLSVKARLDFGTGWVSPIGWVKSPGV